MPRSVNYWFTHFTRDGDLTRRELDQAVRVSMIDRPPEKVVPQVLRAYAARPKDLYVEDAAVEVMAILKSLSKEPQPPSSEQVYRALELRVQYTSRGGEPDLPDPRVSLDYLSGVGTRLRKRRLDGDLFGPRGPLPTDVRQGYINNCYFAGSCAAVAFARPDLIQAAIREVSPEIYSARFFDHRGDALLEREHLVDGDVYVDAGEDAYGSLPDAGTRREGPMWYPLLEKGYGVKLDGSYFNLDQGGYSAEVLTMLTGCRVVSGATCSKVSQRALLALLRTVEKNRWPATLETHAKDKAERYKRTGVDPDHVYAFMGLVEENGVTKVRVFDTRAQGPKGHDNGVFTLSLKRALGLFEYVAYVKVPPRTAH